ncbi:MAG: hypothetical protein QXT28_09120 [Thermofilaceae archaeon]
MSFVQQRGKYLPAEEPGDSAPVYAYDVQQQAEQPERAQAAQQRVAAGGHKLVSAEEQASTVTAGSGKEVTAAPPEAAASVYYGGKHYSTFFKDVAYELPTGEVVTYRYWYNPETHEWIMGPKIAGPETRWVYRSDERVGLEYEHRGQRIAAAPPPITAPVSESEKMRFIEAWRTYYDRLEAERRAQAEEALALTQLRQLAEKLGIETDTSLGVLQVRVVQAALEKAGMKPGEAYETALKFQYADPREVLEFLTKAEVEYEGVKYSLLQWAVEGENIVKSQEHYLKQLDKWSPPEPPSFEELYKAYREAWRIGASPATTFLESVASGFTRTLAFGLLDVGGDVQRKVAAGINRFLDIFASKVHVPEPTWRAIATAADPLGVQRAVTAVFGLDYDKMMRAAAGALKAPELSTEEKAELAAIASEVSPHAPALIFGTAVGTGFAAAVQSAFIEKALSAVPESVKAKVSEKLSPKKIETRVEIPTEFEIRAELKTRISRIETVEELEPGFSEWMKRYYTVKQELQYILTPTKWEKIPPELQHIFEKVPVGTQPMGVIPFKDIFIAGEKVPKTPEIFEFLKPSYVREWDSLVAPGWFEKVPAEKVVGMPRFTQFYDIYRGPAATERFVFQTWLENPYRWRGVLYEPAKPMDLLIARGEGAGVDWAAYVRATREYRTPDLPLGLEDLGKQEIVQTQRITARLTLDIERYLAMLRERLPSTEEVLYGTKAGGGSKTPLKFDFEAPSEKAAAPPAPAAPPTSPASPAAKSSTPSTPTSPIARLAEPKVEPALIYRVTEEVVTERAMLPPLKTTVPLLSASMKVAGGEYALPTPKLRLEPPKLELPAKTEPTLRLAERASTGVRGSEERAQPPSLSETYALVALEVERAGVREIARERASTHEPPHLKPPAPITPSSPPKPTSEPPSPRKIMWPGGGGEHRQPPQPKAFKVRYWQAKWFYTPAKSSTAKRKRRGKR